ncbi:MAG: YceI family protein [Syntrophobacteraceae bacterium]|nr:YceI family protein [Syntrophobacteraceae bacterium]
MEDAKSFAKITAEELYDKVSQKTSLIIIDTLPKELFDKRHLPGAQNACVFQVVFPSEVQAIAPDRDREVILYGSSSASHDSVTAAEKLVRLGYRKVFVLTGGLAAWRQAGYPLKGNDPDSVDDGDHLVLDDRSYIVDIEKSIIEWTGRNPNMTHNGTLRLLRGDITIQQGSFNGTFEIDMHSLKNMNLEGNEWQPVLVAHLKSDDFFFAEKFPTARFTIDAARKIGESLTAANFEVEGALELRGLRNAMKFLATINNLSDGAISAEAHFDFDRTQWKIIYGSSRYFEHLGMHLVFDPISIGLRIVAR